jgi:pseudouridine-5'-phosphate glycosidase
MVRKLDQYLDILPEIKDAIDAGRPVVALESTIISHGMPYPRNVETAKEVEKVVRDNGAVPATIAILGGRIKVGLTPDEIDALGKSGLDVIKASRRDIPFIVARGEDGATTVAATMIRWSRRKKGRMADDVFSISGEMMCHKTIMTAVAVTTNAEIILIIKMLVIAPWYFCFHSL